MLRLLAVFFILAVCHWGVARPVTLERYGMIELPVTPFSNMASGYQATNPGFRLILRSESGDFIAGGSINMDSVIRGYNDDASQGSPYGQLVLRVEMVAAYPGITSGIMTGKFNGSLSVCMAKDTDSSIRGTECRNLRGNIHPERPFQWLNKKVEFEVVDRQVRITRFHGYTGDGGTSRQIALAVMHPAFGFAAPGKAFKDYQSPLVLDLNHNGRLDLINVWDSNHFIQFDLSGAGKLIRTGWVQPADGILFWDDGSGCAHNGSQFLGEFTRSKTGERTFNNGFEALAKLFDGQGKGVVVPSQHPRLKVWRNWAKDGVCKATEVYAASEFAKEIALSFTRHDSPELNEDNEVRLTGHYIGTDGKKHLIGDVWFKQRRNELANLRRK